MTLSIAPLPVIGISTFPWVGSVTGERVSERRHLRCLARSARKGSVRESKSESSRIDLFERVYTAYWEDIDICRDSGIVD